MKVVTWNIELGQNVEQAAAEIHSNPDLREPDVLLVQEMDPEGTALLAQILGLDYRYAAPARHPETGKLFGNAVLSSWPMGEAVVTPLPHTAPVQGQQRAATSASVIVDGVEIMAHSIHLETVLLDVRRRVQQVQAITATVNQRSTKPCVVGGDFNAASGRSLRNFDRPLVDAGLTRITSGLTTTFRRFGRGYSLDHVYTRGLDVQNVGVDPNAGASDHQPVWAHVGIKPVGSGLHG